MSNGHFRERVAKAYAIPLAATLFVALVTFALSRILLAVGKNSAVIFGTVITIAIIAGAGFISNSSDEARKPNVLAVLLVGIAVVASGIVAGAVVGEAPLEHASEEPGAPPHGNREPGPGAPGPITVGDNFFEPQELRVKAGTIVVWEQAGTVSHTVTASDGSWDSHPNCPGECMEQGDTFEFTFDEPGEVPYYCRLHGTAAGQGMAGTIVVEA